MGMRHEQLRTLRTCSSSCPLPRDPVLNVMPRFGEGAQGGGRV